MSSNYKQNKHNNNGYPWSNHSLRELSAMEQQTQPSKRRQLQEQQEVNSQSPQADGPPPGTHHKPYPHGEGHMIIKDNFTQPVGSYN